MAIQSNVSQNVEGWGGGRGQAVSIWNWGGKLDLQEGLGVRQDRWERLRGAARVHEVGLGGVQEGLGGLWGESGGDGTRGYFYPFNSPREPIPSSLPPLPPLIFTCLAPSSSEH